MKSSVTGNCSKCGEIEWEYVHDISGYRCPKCWQIVKINITPIMYELYLEYNSKEKTKAITKAKHFLKLGVRCYAGSFYNAGVPWFGIFVHKDDVSKLKR